MANACIKLYKDFHTQNLTLLDDCVAEGCVDELAKCHATISDLNRWLDVLKDEQEIKLLKSAFREYEFALLCLTQGYYRQAFASLRLFIEMSFLVVQLSTNQLDLRLWLAGKKDTNWNAIVSEDNGIFSPQFVGAFCEELVREAKHFRELSKKLYRECSHFVHGNDFALLATPKKVSFSKESFLLWSDKAASSLLVVYFALTIRYIKDLEKPDLTILENSLLEILGHTEGVKSLLGKA